MKIAIFGDSFANYKLGPEYGQQLPSTSKCWFDVVNEKHEIINFGLTGSCFQYSYELFLENHTKFDYVIFFVTTPTRKYLKILDPIVPNQHMLGGNSKIEEVKQICNALDIPNKEKYIRILDSFSVYYNEWRDEKYENIIHETLVKSISTIKPNSLIVPCFLDSIPFLNFPEALLTISLAEVLPLFLKNNIDPTNDIILDYQCLRYCHLSEKNNIILGNMILSAIENSTTYLKLNIKDFDMKLDKPLEYYYRKIKH